jgi:exopolysaccharide production protein ExoY
MSYLPGIPEPQKLTILAPDRRFPQARFYAAGAKRFFDIVMSLTLLPVLAPFILLMWALVRLDAGPGFYGQPRVGRDGRIFTCWKLRTMLVDAEGVLARMIATDPKVAREWRVYQKLSRDPRITRVGAFLRSTSLDELPQIWNVLRGDMSLVGPRPFLPSQASLYTEAGGVAYFAMRPGITGEWQVNGRNATAFVDRVRYDNRYSRHMSLLTDLRLLLRTPIVVLRRTGR